MTRKTLLALGGSRLVMPIIETAHGLGHRVVTCDYLPDNYAHQHSDEYRNVSITDHEAVLTTAKDVGADGVLSWAADPGVLAAAYTAEELGLPFQASFSATNILQDKALFRAFLQDNDFPSPIANTYHSVPEAAAEAKALAYPVIVKPTDAAGSKGVSRVDKPAELSSAVQHALAYSQKGIVVVETYIERYGRQISAEGFIVDGHWHYIGFMDQLFDERGPNPYAPVGNILPSQMDRAILDRLNRDLTRVAEILKLTTGIYNIESRVSIDGTPYILEISPRGGGNRLAEFIRSATGVDLIKATVEASLGAPVTSDFKPDISGTWVQQILFSRTRGTYAGVHIDSAFERAHVREMAEWAKPGDAVEPFGHASFALGSAFQQFATYEDAERACKWPNQLFSLFVSTTQAGAE
jgi:biotin carboxylase